MGSIVWAYPDRYSSYPEQIMWLGDDTLDYSIEDFFGEPTIKTDKIEIDGRTYKVQVDTEMLEELKCARTTAHYKHDGEWYKVRNGTTLRKLHDIVIDSNKFDNR